MPPTQIAGLLFDAWDDLDRAMAGLNNADAERSDRGSSFAWTLAHVTNQLDAWTNVRFAGHAPQPLLSEVRFRIGGLGTAEDWRAIRAAVAGARATARAYLEPLTDSDLDLTVPYDGSLAHLRKPGLNLRYALLRTIAHHYFHLGEIAAKRALLGHSTGDYPGLLNHTLRAG